MVLAQIWLTGRSKKGDLLPIACPEEKAALWIPTLAAQKCQLANCKGCALHFLPWKQNFIFFNVPRVTCPEPLCHSYAQGSEQPQIYLHERLLLPKANGEGRQREAKCLAQHHTGNLRPSSARSSSPALQSQPGPRSQQTWGRENPYENNETRISTCSQITTLNKFGATQLLLPTVSPMAQSWLDTKYQLPGRLGWAASSSSALHLEPVVLMLNHKTTARPWCIYHVWLRDPCTDIHCSWTRDRRVSRSPILELLLISQLTLHWSIH